MSNCGHQHSRTWWPEFATGERNRTELCQAGLWFGWKLLSDEIQQQQIFAKGQLSLQLEEHVHPLEAAPDPHMTEQNPCVKQPPGPVAISHVSRWDDSPWWSSLHWYQHRSHKTPHNIYSILHKRLLCYCRLSLQQKKFLDQQGQSPLKLAHFLLAQKKDNEAWPETFFFSLTRSNFCWPMLKLPLVTAAANLKKNPLEHFWSLQAGNITAVSALAFEGRILHGILITSLSSQIVWYLVWCISLCPPQSFSSFPLGLDSTDSRFRMNIRMEDLIHHKQIKTDELISSMKCLIQKGKEKLVPWLLTRFPWHKLTPGECNNFCDFSRGNTGAKLPECLSTWREEGKFFDPRNTKLICYHGRFMNMCWEALTCWNTCCLQHQRLFRLQVPHIL